MAASSIDALCVLCNKDMSKDQQEDIITLGKKGSVSVNEKSEERGSEVRTQEGQRVHKECRKRWGVNYYIQAAKGKEQVDAQSPCKLRSQNTKFEINKHCILCCQPAQCDGRRRSYDTYPVRTTAFETSIKQVCKERNDEWSHDVRGRLSYANDLCAKNAVYHQQCSTNFRTGRSIPKLFNVNGAEPDKRPRIESSQRALQDKNEAFLFVTKYLEENDDEQITIIELTKKMQEFLTETGSTQVAYGVQYMKKKLEDHYGDSIIFTNLEGKANVVTFRSTASSILYNYYQQPKCDDDEQESKRIIQTAAKLINNNIKALASYTDYPNAQDFTTENAMAFLPDSLKLFLQVLFVGKNTEKKQASVGHAIVQATRPRVITAPLQLGLAVQMHHHFGSRFLVDSLHQHGFCSSYSEVQKFLRSASVASQDTPLTSETQFVQYAADNVDHNLRTLDGLGTFHGMGMIATITPGQDISRVVPRKLVTTDDIIKQGRVKIYQYNYPKVQQPLTYSELSALRAITHNVVQKPLTDILWHVSPFLQWPRPGWSGFMQMVHKGNHPGKATVVFLPMIDLDPTDMTCIYSTLLFLSDQARTNHATPVITFDQPLWWKAQTIITNEPQDSNLKSVVLQIGGLHTEMSFLGCIGHLMDKSGLTETLEVVYGSNAVLHMLSGKALARARRGHFLVDAALNIILAADAFQVLMPTLSMSGTAPEVELEVDPEVNQDISSQADEDELSESDARHQYCPSDGDCSPVDTLDSPAAAEGCSDSLSPTDSSSWIQKTRETLEKLMLNGSIDEESTLVLMEVNARIEQEKKRNEAGRTGCLWLQYMKMVDILKRFLRAERTGDWSLHLASLHERLPYFAAAGHNLYAKTIFVYLQQMAKLETDHPNIYSVFFNGLHVVRRSDRYWAGLSTDLIIEQMLMRSIKSSGGLTRGRGMTELQRLVWVKSMPFCSDMNQSMQYFTGVTYHTSEQHVEASDARQKRDCKETDKLVNFLHTRNPFSKNDTSLRSIVSGVVAHESVNVDHAGDVGQKILESMQGRIVTEYSFKRKQQATTIGSKTAVTINNEPVQIDPQLLFQRLTVVAASESMDLRELFKYELCSYPAALFDATFAPRQADKPVLANALWNEVKLNKVSQPSQPLYVLDGGALLHRIPWQRGATFGNICSCYVRYVIHKYDRCIVVFDGYCDGPSAKDATHLRRGSINAAAVHCDLLSTLTVKKDVFLLNSHNKQRFIHMLSDKLKQAGCQTIHSTGDADLLIAQSAVSSAANRETVVIADDTDILVLLCHYENKCKKRSFFKPEPKRGFTQGKVWDIQVTCSVLGSSLCRHLPFLHALLGCDTTSRLFGIGKAVGLKKRMQLYQHAEVFHNMNSSKQDVITAGKNALVEVYGGKPSESLETLRHRRFCEKTTKRTTAVEVKSLPPTSSAAKFHSMRVYYQVQLWLGNEKLQPCDWGWKEVDGALTAMMNDMPPAPEVLLQVIKCNCKADCSTARCTCRKHGLDCSPACGECRGTACFNSPVHEDEIDSKTEDELK